MKQLNETKYLAMLLVVGAAAGVGGCMSAEEPLAKDPTTPAQTPAPGHTPDEPGATPEGGIPANAGAIATTRRIEWNVDMPNVEPGIWEHAKLSAYIEALPMPGATVHWEPRATIQLSYHQTNFNNGTSKLAVLIAPQSAQVLDVTAEGFTLRTADGTDVAFLNDQAMLTHSGEATLAAFTEKANWAISDVWNNWCAAMQGPTYSNQDMWYYGVADLPGSYYVAMDVPAVSTTYGLVKRIQDDHADLLCILADSSATCQLIVDSTAMMAISDTTVNFLATAGASKESAFRQALLPQGQNEATFGPVRMKCSADGCSFYFEKSRSELADPTAAP